MLEILHSVAVAVGHAHKVEDVIRTAAAEIRLGLGMEMAGLYLFDPSSGQLTVDPYEELSPLFAATHEDAYRRAAAESGADAFLPKQTRLRDLLATIRELVDDH